MNKTNIVIHLAATVRFDVNLKRAYNINCKSTHEIVNLCKEMPNLKVSIRRFNYSILKSYNLHDFSPHVSSIFNIH